MGQSRHSGSTYFVAASRPSEFKPSMRASQPQQPPPLPPRAPPRKPPPQQQPPRNGDLFSPVLLAPGAVRPASPDTTAGSGLCLKVPTAVGAGPEEDLLIVERCFNLAKLMLSPEGLAIKKVTLEGFAIPTSLRLLHHQPPASALMALTWLEYDTVGLDVRGLTTVSRGFLGRDDAARSSQRPQGTAAAAGFHTGSKREGKSGPQIVGSIGGGEEGRDGDKRCCWGRQASLIVVLAWSSGAEVVLEAASRDQRDLLARCVELIMSDVLRLEGPLQEQEQEQEEEQQQQQQQDAAALDHKGGCCDGGGVVDNNLSSIIDCVLDTTDQRRARDDDWREMQLPGTKNNGSSTAAAAAAAAAAADAGNGIHPVAAFSGVITSPNGSLSRLTPPPQPPPPRALHGSLSPPPPSTLPASLVLPSSPPLLVSARRPTGRRSFEQPLVRGFSAPCAVWRRQRGVSSTSSRGLAVLAARARSGGGSLSPTPGRGGRSRESGGWAGGGVGAGPAEGRCDAEAAVELRRRTEEVMTRILLGYDRAKDEAQAAAWRVGAIKLKKLLARATTRQVEARWARWCEAVRDKNEERQRADRLQWCLHAKANRDNDLLAWYHSTFCREVYRQRVPFWYRETRLQPYQKAYRIVDDRESYTPMEKSIMTSCVCTVGTKYADVAAQLFTSKDILSEEEYRLFQTLVKRGAKVSKATPKSGRKVSHPMKLRLWFNRGALCLTAKREKPDKAASNDHSFYLSKVKICLLTVPAGATGEGRGAEGFRRTRLDDSSGVLSSNVSSTVSSNESSRGGGGVGKPSPLPAHGRDGFGAKPEGFRSDEADRSGGRGGFGDGDGDYDVGTDAPAGGSMTLPSRGLERGAGGGLASPPPSSHEPPRVLSILFFGRSISLNLWFSTEEEGATWQGMLMKLSWKEQGFLCRPPGQGEGEGGELQADFGRGGEQAKLGRGGGGEGEKKNRAGFATPFSSTSSYSSRGTAQGTPYATPRNGDGGGDGGDGGGDGRPGDHRYRKHDGHACFASSGDADAGSHGLASRCSIGSGGGGGGVGGDGASCSLSENAITRATTKLMDYTA